ncbi:plastocyanin/azurin family copper-binding protein [Demequina sp. SO4-13]|uniref:plastocyanin/azurin family copper-binding protein n=1 Tax=Demequina sp. SO4-13 TaxID=3401027 RepID=UPI003AF4FF9F
MAHLTLTRRAAAAAVATIAAVALSACGSSGGGDVVDLGTGNSAPASTPEPTGGTGGGAEEQAALVAVSAFEYGYQLVAPIEAGRYTFEMFNDGDMQHDLVLEGEDARGATAIINPGETDSFTVDLEPGTYTLYCSVGAHRAQGMEVTFTVT